MAFTLPQRPKPRLQERRTDRDDVSIQSNAASTTTVQATVLSKPSTKKTPFPLLDLPPEIREKIYVLICTHPLPNPILLVRHRPVDAHPVVDLRVDMHFPHFLVLTCQQLYHEVRPIYWRVNAFCLRLGRNTELLDHFLTTPFQDNRREVRSLRLEIRRWRKGDFFVCALVPALEDMILNGRLREIEVWLEKDYLLRLGDTGLGPGAVDNCTGMSRPAPKPVQAVYRLKRLLQDPYLEKVVVKANRNRGFWSWRVDWGMPDESFEGMELEDVTHLFLGAKPVHIK